MTVRKMNSYIKKNSTLESFNVEDYSEYNLREIYSISVEIANKVLEKVIIEKVWNKNHGIIPFLNDCEGNFDLDRYSKYLEYRKTNKSDSSSLKFFILKYGKDFGLKKI